MSFLWWKLIHLSAAIVWCASALGAFWYVIVAWWERRKLPEDQELVRRDEWVRWHFLVVVILEHVSFLVLLPSGWYLMTSMGYKLAMGWLAAKVAIVVFVLIPLEVFDIWLSHWQVPRTHLRRVENPDAYARAVRLHNIFLVVGMAVVGICIPAILWLVVFKPPL